MNEERDNGGVLLEELHLGPEEIESDEVKARGDARLARAQVGIDWHRVPFARPHSRHAAALCVRT